MGEKVKNNNNKSHQWQVTRKLFCFENFYPKRIENFAAKYFQFIWMFSLATKFCPNSPAIGSISCCCRCFCPMIVLINLTRLSKTKKEIQLTTTITNTQSTSNWQIKTIDPKQVSSIFTKSKSKITFSRGPQVRRTQDEVKKKWRRR